jgi:predicted flap endonuclease-1-like 5' DNA nuclease
VLTTLGVVILALVAGAFLGLLTAWPAWTREARQRQIEAMVTRGEIERQANRISFLENRVRERDSEIKHLESDLSAKDLLNEGLKIGMAQLRDRLSDLEREVAEASARVGQQNGDWATERLRERVAELEPLTVQLATRDRRIRELEGLAGELEEWKAKLQAVREEHREEVAARESEVEDLRRRVVELEPLAEQLPQRDDMLEEVARLKAEVETREDRIRRLQDEQQRAMERKDQKVEGLRKRIATLEPQLARLAERGTQVEELEATVRELKEEQRRLEQEHRLHTETQEARIESLRDEVSEIPTLRERLAARETRLEELQFLESQLSDLEELEGRLREREVRLNELERQHSLTADDKDREIARLRERIGELAPLAERLDRRQERVAALEQALEAERVEREDLRKQLEARQVPIDIGEQDIDTLRAEHSATLQNKERELERLRKRIAQLQPQARRPRRGAGRGTARTRQPSPRKDNLKRIRGIGPALERKLNDLGCYTFDDIVGWESTEIERVARALRASPKRIKSEWMQQARVYAQRDGKNS